MVNLIKLVALDLISFEHEKSFLLIFLFFNIHVFYLKELQREETGWERE